MELHQVNPAKEQFFFFKLIAVEFLGTRQKWHKGQNTPCLAIVMDLEVKINNALLEGQ